MLAALAMSSTTPSKNLCSWGFLCLGSFAPTCSNGLLISFRHLLKHHLLREAFPNRLSLSVCPDLWFLALLKLQCCVAHLFAYCLVFSGRKVYHIRDLMLFVHERTPKIVLGNQEALGPEMNNVQWLSWRTHMRRQVPFNRLGSTQEFQFAWRTDFIASFSGVPGL